MFLSLSLLFTSRSFTVPLKKNVCITLSIDKLGFALIIKQLEAMGFDRALVLEVFFACNKNEELAANYLLDHMHEFEE